MPVRRKICAKAENMRMEKRRDKALRDLVEFCPGP